MKNLYDLTSPQKSIWLTEKYFANTTVNNVCGTVIMKELINFDLLNTAIKNMVKKNDIFRLRFIEKNGILKQYFEEESNPKEIELITISSKEEIADIEKKLLSRVFNFSEELYEIKMYKVKNSNICGCLINIHHIIADAVTIGVICRDVMNEYKALQNNTEFERNSKFLYENFIKAESEYYSSAKYLKDKTYWNDKFSDIPNIVTIPSSNKINNTNSCSANRYTYVIDKEKVEKISEFCSNNKISVFNFFMAILSIYMYRINNTNDFVIGTPILNRTNYVEKNTSGMFINVAPCRIKIDKNSNILNLLSSVSTTCMELLRHQKYSYQSILEDIRKKYPNTPNLYNVILSYQVTDTTSETDIDYETRWPFNGNTTSDVDIHLYDTNQAGNLIISYDYRKDKYLDNDIIELNNRMIYLINQILENTTILLKDLEIVTPEERNELLEDFNSTKLDYDEQIPIIKSFEKQVELTPNAIALSFKNNHFTYKELNELANILANELKSKEITNNSIVAILMERSAEIIISILAILKAGGAYLPIDSDYPENRITQILTESESKLVLYNSKKPNYLDDYNSIDVNLSKIKNLKYSYDNFENSSKPNDLSYIIYTSGSTGKPKGVMLTQKNYTNFLASMRNKVEYLNFEEKLSVISVTTVSFDIFGFESIISLCCGLHLYLTDYFEQKQTNTLEKYLVDNKIDIIQTTPSVLYHHIQSAEDKSNFANIKYFILAGEPLSSKLVEEIHKISPNCTIYNGYGPSETTIFSAFTKIIDEENIIIGKPIDNTKIYILDDNQKLLPKNTLGEIYIGGDGVGNGYLNRLALTNESFLDNPFHPGKMYKTGDLGLWLNTKELQCSGRIDTQIKLHGLRIELAEIEQKISSFLGFDSRVCVLLQNIDDNKIIHAFIESTEIVKLEKLKNHLLLNLPNYMIPTAYTVLKNFPQTPNGKVDKKELAKIIDFSETESREIEKPSTELEEKLYRLILKYAENKNFGVTDDFFSIGLDSLKLINIVTEINSDFNTNLLISNIYNLLNIRELARHIEITNQKPSRKLQELFEEQQNFSTSSAQKRIYYTCQMASSNQGVYNICGGIEFFEKLNLQKVNSCFNELIERHEAFRTYFTIIDREVYQKIEPSISIKIDSVEVAEDKIEEEFYKFNSIFNLSVPPLLKVKVIYLENNHTMIFINMHHIISDGMSMHILLNEFTKLYSGEKLDKLKFTYKEFIKYENYFYNSEKYEDDKTFWMSEYENGVPILNLPTNFTRPSKFTYTGKTIHLKIADSLSRNIYDLSKQCKVTPYMLLLATYYILLYKYTAQDNIVVGTPVANRDIPEFRNVIGMFVNTLPIRKSIHSKKSFYEFLMEVKIKVLNCFKHQNYPFDELVKDLNIARDISKNPLFDTMFTYQSTNDIGFDKNEFKTKYYLPENNISKFDISFEIVPINNSFDLNIEYCTDLFTEEFIKNMSNHYLELLKLVCKNVNTSIDKLNILTTEELNMLLYDFNDTKVEYNKNDFIYKLIDEQSKKTPEYVAITFKDSKLTYKELYEKTNSLANHLHSLGIGKNSVVVVMLPRSLELLVALIAVLKTGAAYVPVDPAFPKSRVEYMLKNSNATMILTLNEKVDTDTTSLCVSFENEKLYQKSELDFVPSTNCEDPAYIIYTSGSTGNPKGVVIPHRAVTNLAVCMNEEVQYLKEDFGNMAIASLTTVSFDIFVFETLISLQKGLNVIMATENEQVMPTLINELLKNNNVKAFQTTPSKMEILVNNQNLIPSLKDIKYITLVGEALTNNLKNRIRKIGNITVYNAYGPTETTVFSTYTDVSNYKNVTIGKPMFNTQIYILDKDNNLCPINVPGELCIGGDGVGLGYKNIGPNVKNSYTKNPFNKQNMYKTGDMAQYLPNGELMYIGRIDNQIKIRGLRIELEEIESRILEFPNINKTVILAQTDSNNRTYLVAYLTITDKISINKLREHLRKYLPKYMIPSYFEILNEFPYTPNGKVDKKLLPPPKFAKVQQEFVPARNDLDKKILTIFEELLNISPIGITDNFFELGGDSLLAINLQIELMKFTEGISYADIFLNPTVEELTNKINNTENLVESLSNTIDLLNCNTYIMENSSKNDKIRKRTLGNIVLIGVTGYLGCHVLSNFLENESGNVYCLIRKDNGISLEKKFLNTLHFYFGDKYDDLIDKRIFILKGDIVLDKFGLKENDINLLKDNVSSIINCAAKVSHFGKYELYKKINVDGVENIVNFCKEYKKALYHISTTSVAGEGINENELNNNEEQSQIPKFSEKDFFINQKIDNVYVKSKFEAEKLIITELQNGLDAYILRVGNIMGRYSDGHFQKNIEENAYINRLLSFIKIKNVPKYFISHTLEFTPVDCCADAIIKIAKHSHKNQRIFHLQDNKRILIKDLLDIFEKNYFKLNLVSNKEFKEIIQNLMKLNNSKEYLNGIISDFDKSGKLDYIQKVEVVSDISNQYLKDMNFEWPEISEEYITKFFNYLNNLNNF